MPAVQLVSQPETLQYANVACPVLVLALVLGSPVVLFFDLWNCIPGTLSLYTAIPRGQTQRLGELDQLVDRPLSMREVPGSKPGSSTFAFLRLVFSSSPVVVGVSSRAIRS